jgi:hypothetical protein
VSVILETSPIYDLPLDAGFGHDTYPAIRFNPAAAVAAQRQNEKLLIQQAAIAESVKKMKGTATVEDCRVSVLGEAGKRQQLDMPGYIEWLGEQAQSAFETYVEAGGEKAVAAYVSAHEVDAERADGHNG